MKASRPPPPPPSDAEHAKRLEAALHVFSPAYSVYAERELAESSRLSPLACAAWHRLKLHAWVGGGADSLPQGYLPDNDRELAQMTGLTAEQWSEVRTDVLKRFPRAGKGRRQHRELVDHRLEQALRKVNAGGGGLKKAANLAAQRAEPTDQLPTPVATGYRTPTGTPTEPLPTTIPSAYRPGYRNGTGPPTDGLPDAYPLSLIPTLSPSLPVSERGEDLSASSSGNGGKESSGEGLLLPPPGEGLSFLAQVQMELHALPVRCPLTAAQRRLVIGWEAAGHAEAVLSVVRTVGVREKSSGNPITSFAYFVPAIESALQRVTEGQRPLDEEVDLEGYRAFVRGQLHGGSWSGVNAAAVARAIELVDGARSCAEIAAAAGRLAVPAWGGEVGE